MKNIRFAENTYNCSTREIIELMQYFNSTGQFDKQDIFITLRDIVECESPLMVSTLFNIQCILQKGKTYECSYFVYENYRAKDFCCQNKMLTTVESFKSPYITKR